MKERRQEEKKKQDGQKAGKKQRADRIKTKFLMNESEKFEKE